MPLLEKLKSLFSQDAYKRAYVFIPRNHVQNPDFPEDPLEGGKHYFRLWLAEMFLQKKVDWFREWYPMAHSLVTFQFGDQNLEIPHVAGADRLKGLTEDNLEKLIPLNYQLTTLMPFNGGVVELVAALVAMKGKDYVGSIVKVLGDLSQLLTGPQLSASLAIALPIANGVQDLIGGPSGKIHVGIHQAFVGKGGTGQNVLRAGYFAVIDGAAQDFPAESLWVKQDRLHFGSGMNASDFLTGVTHMLFRIERRDERDDWTSLKSIQDAYAEALRQLGEGEDEKADLALKRAIVIARTSPDLTRADRNRVAMALKEEFDQAKGAGLGAIPTADRYLNSLMSRRAVSIESAVEEEASWEKLLA